MWIAVIRVLTSSTGIRTGIRADTLRMGIHTDTLRMGIHTDTLRMGAIPMRCNKL